MSLLHTLFLFCNLLFRLTSNLYFTASGLNQLEALATPELRSERLRAVRSAIQELPMTLPVHLELASMTDTTFLQSMASTMYVQN